MSPVLNGITRFALTTAIPDRLLAFYTDGVGFTAAAPAPIPADEMALLGLAGGGTRQVLTLGGQRVALDAFDQPGRPYPPSANAADMAFQHFAIVTDDAAAAWDRAWRHGALAISRGGPQALPANAGGVIAVKFRDPEGHPLEFLQFPAAGPSGWTGRGALGIDHSAISVGDIDEAIAFFTSLGLALGGRTLNHGPAQEALDGLDGVDVDVVAMMAKGGGPHLELLGYRNPKPHPATTMAANDVAAMRIVWQADRDALIRDPFGHLHLLRR